jgi:hypothetical protein
VFNIYICDYYLGKSLICCYLLILSHMIAVLKEELALIKLREILSSCVTEGTICGPCFLKTRMYCPIKLNDVSFHSLSLLLSRMHLNVNDHSF